MRKIEIASTIKILVAKIALSMIQEKTITLES